ncbi:AAA family ATPase [Saccharicrinis sp. FJH54]|uniref:AAA family ATPase n=1 Tax=Saccharicrinis sp. FJH54 TaxID=3344665 RepID=UPI0035D46C88
MGKVVKMPTGEINLTDLKRDIAKYTGDESENKILDIRKAKEWMDHASKQPIPKQLLGCLWYQSELAILFADTNLGKSVFAVQMADSLTKGKAFIPFMEKCEKFKVLYCDFEMSSKQFENRYSYDYTNHYEFNENFFRAELNLDEFLLNSELPLEEEISKTIIQQIVSNHIDIVIIDNLTYITREIEKSKNIQPIMQKLKWINKEYGVSIMVLAHTPKRDDSKPLTSNDINGSKFLSNFSDSIIGVGKSCQDEYFRYVKQIKSRNSEYQFGSDNVAVFIIDKEYNFLEFIFQNIDSESNHLKIPSEDDKVEMENQILFLAKEHPEWSNQKIADEVGTNRMRVKRVKDRNFKK